MYTDRDPIEVAHSPAPVEEEGEGVVMEYDRLQGGPSTSVELVGDGVWPLALQNCYLFL